MPTNKLLISNFRALLGFLGEGSCFRSGLILHNGEFCVRKTQKVEPVALERYIWRYEHINLQFYFSNDAFSWNHLKLHDSFWRHFQARHRHNSQLNTFSWQFLLFLYIYIYILALYVYYIYLTKIKKFSITNRLKSVFKKLYINIV